MIWWNKHKWKVLLPAAAAVILLIAFLAGGKSDTPAEIPAETETICVTETPEVSPSQPTQTETPAQPSETPSEEPAEIPTEAPAESSETSEVTPSEQPAASENPQQEGQGQTTTVVLTPNPQKQPDTTPAPQTSSSAPQNTAPAASEPVPAETETPQPQLTCTISVSCNTVFNHTDWIDAGILAGLPGNGAILPARTVTFESGETVFDVLKRECRNAGIQLEFMNSVVYGSAYVEGIDNLYEFDCGEQSGWMYSVNGYFPNYGATNYDLSDGDVICWVYTCDQGADVGAR